MSDFDLIIRGATVVRSEGASKQDLGIKDGVITALGNAVFGSTEADLDATDFHVLPGVIDPHVHFNEPGREDWEGFTTGTRALAAGGVTAYFDMPLNASPPVLDKGSFLAKWNCAKTHSLVDFGLWGGLTPDNLDRLEELAECGVIGFKAFMCSTGVDDFAMADDTTLLEGMRRAAELDQIVAVHAENNSITGRLTRQAFTEGRLTARDYMNSRPVIAELEAIQRAILFAWETDCPLHIVHVSTGRGIELVTSAKQQGLNVSCETCPHYLILNEADLERLQAIAKCPPPLRSPTDQADLWDQLLAGWVDLIGSDHSPTTPERKFKENLFDAWGGIAGCQSTLPLMLTAAAEKGEAFPIARLTDLLSLNVARRFRLQPAKGEIALGADADLVVVRLGEEDIVREDALFYRHPAHSPYLGRQVYGRISRTILRGETIYKDGHIVGKPVARLLRPAKSDPTAEP